MSFKFTLHDNLFEDQGNADLIKFLDSKGITKETVLVAPSGSTSLAGILKLSGVDEFKIDGGDELFTTRKYMSDCWCFFTMNEIKLEVDLP